ncbi:MAG: hypothetical protein H6R10_2017 [Rhodocyclaceae bacterium]|nr:hypothetical protein [Rhodocyclaceae bacterium]
MTDLERAYRATAYRVFLSGGALDLRIDAPCPALAAWLQAQGVAEWAILTAANPASRQLPAQENAARQAELECALLEDGFEPFAGENIADAGNWPAEESCFVSGITRSEAVALALRFGQNAMVFGVADGVPRLVWTESTNNEQEDRSL